MMFYVTTDYKQKQTPEYSCFPLSQTLKRFTKTVPLFQLNIFIFLKVLFYLKKKELFVLTYSGLVTVILKIYKHFNFPQFYFFKY